MVRRSQSEKKMILDTIHKKIHELPHDDLLPMPHDAEDKKISLKIWAEWCARHSLYLDTHKNCGDIFSQSRPSEATVQCCLKLLEEFEFPTIEPTRYRTIFSEADDKVRQLAAQQASIIVLDVFLAAAAGNGQITYRKIFDALCRGFSDHFLSMQGRVKSVRDMRPETVAQCRRDLILSGVIPLEHWRSIINWVKNPFFTIDHCNTGNRASKRIREKSADSLKEQYQKIIAADPRYVSPSPSGIKGYRKDSCVNE